MNRELARAIRQRADGKCEYCRIPQFAFPLPFQIDHIIAEQHGGQSVANNLVWRVRVATGIKALTLLDLIRSRAKSSVSFIRERISGASISNSNGALIVGKTSIGHVTVQVLSMNDYDLLLLRVQLIEEGAGLL